MLIVDAHLDLAAIAGDGRALELPAAEQTPTKQGTPTVGLPDLRAGGVALVCATIFCQPSLNGKPGYHTADEANAAAMPQLDWYRQRHADGSMRLIKSASELDEPINENLPPTRAILLMEGADPLRNPDDVKYWHDAGLRIVGLAWKPHLHAGGTDAPGPLTPAGISLVKTLDTFNIIHDTSHLAEESFWQLLDLSSGPVMASHSNCRSIVPTDRQLSDEMIRAIVKRGGVIGINFYEKFLLPPGELGTRRATLADVVRHIRAMCNLAGNANQIGIGTDMDGGFGREKIPVEIQTSADLKLLAPALSSAGFFDIEIAGIMGQNWLNFFAAIYPFNHFERF